MAYETKQKNEYFDPIYLGPKIPHAKPVYSSLSPLKGLNFTEGGRCLCLAVGELTHQQTRENRFHKWQSHEFPSKGFFWFLSNHYRFWFLSYPKRSRKELLEHQNIEFTMSLSKGFPQKEIRVERK